MNQLYKVWVFVLLFLTIPTQMVWAETVEEQLNNLIGPKDQYNTLLSPVYLKNNTTEERINPQSGELVLNQTDYVLPGRRGMDLEIRRIYKSGISNIQEMKVKYVNGAWVDVASSDWSTSTFYEDRYNLGVGMRFSFPAMEVRKNLDGTSHIFLHTDSGDVYRLKKKEEGGKFFYNVEGQTVKDTIITESSDFSNGQEDGTSKFVVTRNDGKKTYFAEDGRVLGIVDRYGNTIKFEYADVKDLFRNKRLISQITDTVGRVITFEYKEDYQYRVGAAGSLPMDPSDSHKASQGPNAKDSGDLDGKYQVIVHLPGDKALVYDKSATLVDSMTKQVMRTRLQRVYDVDNQPKYHYWYEQPDLGFTFSNGTQYSAYNRYENLVQVDYVKTNRVKRYVYDTYTKKLNEDKGSMQYRKVFEQSELIKKGFDATQAVWTDRFVTDTKDKATYKYTGEADGFGADGYQGYNEIYLRDTYRYYTDQTDMRGNLIKYTYDGLQQLVVTDKSGADHKETITSERDELKLVKKQETAMYNVSGGEPVGEPVKKIENYRYDEYGNLTNYTGPEAIRDATGYPVDDERTVVYAYAYDKYHILSQKSWKQDADTRNQIIYAIDDKGNITKETRVNAKVAGGNIITDYEYDSYGNLTRKEVSTGSQSFITQYEYGIDANGTDVKGAYLTKEYGTVDGQESARTLAYDFNNGSLLAENDAMGNKTMYEYDALQRLMKKTMPDNSVKAYSYEENRFANMKIQYTDPEQTPFLNEYDILGALVQASVFDNGAWHVLKKVEYDSKGNKTKETDANGHSVLLDYDSNYRLTRKTYMEQDTVDKGAVTIAYNFSGDTEMPIIVTITDEEGYVQKLYSDIAGKVLKAEVTPDRVRMDAVTYTYDYTGNKLSETNARNYTTGYEYDSLGRMTVKRDALGNETSYAYNALGKIAVQKVPGSKVTESLFDALGRMTMKKLYRDGSPNYLYTAYAYDLNGNAIRTKQGQFTDGVDTVSSDISSAYNAVNKLTDEFRKIDDARTGHISYSYDNNGNKTQMKQYADAAETAFRLFSYHYDFAGRLKEESGAYRESDGNGDYTEHGSYLRKYEQDYAGNTVLAQIFNGSGYDTTQYAYDYRNKLVAKTEPYGNGGGIKITTYRNDKKGNNLSETITVLGAENVTSYEYDGLGRVVKTIDPLGNTSRIIYNEVGNRIKEIDSRYANIADDKAPGIEYEYDPLNRLVKAVAFDGTSREVLAYREYDARGNLVKEADGEGYNAAQPGSSIGTVYEYDMNDKQTKVISAQTFSLNASSGSAYFTKRFVYDGSGNVISETDGLGRETKIAYYLNGLPKEKTYPDGIAERYDYDLSGKAMGAKTDRAGRVTTTFLTIFDKPYRIDYPDGTSVQFAYSAKGDQIESFDEVGNRTLQEYDPSGNSITKKEYIRTDGVNRFYKVSRKQFDELNHLINSETFLRQESGSEADTVETSAGDLVEYSYDKAGRLKTTSGPFGREAIQEYDRAGNIITKLQKVEDGNYDVRRYVYDSRNRVMQEALLVPTSDLSSDQLAAAKFDNEYYDRVLSTTSYDYYKNGKVKSKKDAKGQATIYEYDYDKRPKKKKDPLGAAMAYRYDLAGNLIEEVNARGVSTWYEYDAVNLLIRKITPIDGTLTAVTRYLYDAAGNLIKQIAPNDYDPLKDIPTLLETMAGMVYVYDARNRRTTTIAPDGRGIEYIAYNARGQAVKVVSGIQFMGDISSSLGTVYAYDGLGYVVRSVDAMEYSTSYQYDVLGNVTVHTDARNNTTRYDYNPNGTLEKATFADGGTIAYTYDKQGRKISETNQLNNTNSYSYNAFGQMKTTTDPYGQVTEDKYDLVGNMTASKDKRGSITLFKYDANRKVTEKRTQLDLDKSGNVVYAVEAYTYDPMGNMIKKSISDSKDEAFYRETIYTYYDNNAVATVADNSGAFARNRYDRNGNIIKTEKLRDGDQYDFTKFTYDSMNRVTQRIQLVDSDDFDSEAGYNVPELKDDEYPDKLRVITGYEYDSVGNRVKEIEPRAFAVSSSEDREAFTVRYTYDALNRVKQTIRKVNGADLSTQYNYDEAGNKIAERNERNFETSYSYDNMNHLQTVTDPEQHTLAYQYDLAGNRTIVTNAQQNSVSYSYDKLNRLVTVTDAYNVVIQRNMYDANGNVIKKIDAKGYLSGGIDEERYGSLYEYDLANRLVKMIDPELAARNEPELLTQAYRYNAAGQKVKETDALGHSTSYEYDPAGRLVKMTDPLGVATAYDYDKAGNKLYMIDGRGKATKYSYGAFGLLRETTNAANSSIRYQHDLSANVTVMIDRLGNHTKYQYDNRNFLVEKSVAETGDRIMYAYDEAGNRISMKDDSGISSFTYDSRNQLKRIEKDGVMQLAYTYDEIGNIETVTDAKGFMTTYGYDKSSRMEHVAFNGKTTSYSYDENGNRTSIEYQGGVREEYVFDRTNRLISLANKGPDGSQISKYSYTYDDAGRQATRTDSFGITNYSYDAAGRIEKVEAPGKTTVYGYDRAGNRQSQQETYTSTQPSGYNDPGTQAEVQYMVKKSEYVYSAANELLQLTETMLDAGKKVLEKTTGYLYDENGNEIRQKVSYLRPHTKSMRQTTGGNLYGDEVADELSTLLEKVSSTFDGFNRLKQMEKVKAGERVTVDYIYNGDDLRTRKTVRSSKDGYAEKVTNYLYDRQYVILETDATDQVATRYIRGINYIARIDQSDKLSYYLYNSHGDVVQTVNEAGVVENQYDYDIFGNPTLTIEQNGNAIRYAGEFLDEETGLYYLRARYYNPYTGRFISEDSYWGEDTSPLSLNRYTYAHNDPLKYLDPTGHSITVSIGSYITDVFETAASASRAGLWGMVTGVFVGGLTANPTPAGESQEDIDRIRANNLENTQFVGPTISPPLIGPLVQPLHINVPEAPAIEPTLTVAPIDTASPSFVNRDFTLNDDNTYTVKSGDNLTRISNATGVSIDQIARLNNIQDVNKIREGQILFLSNQIEKDLGSLVNEFPIIQPELGIEIFPLDEMQEPDIDSFPILQDKPVITRFPTTIRGMEVETFPITQEELIIYLTGLKVSSNLLGSGKVGDFTGLKGTTIEDILSRIPSNAKGRILTPIEGGAQEGFEYKWDQDGEKWTVRVHGPDASAPAGSNSAEDWIVRVLKGKKSMDADGVFHPRGIFSPDSPFYDEKLINDVHIPITAPSITPSIEGPSSSSNTINFYISQIISGDKGIFISDSIERRLAPNAYYTNDGFVHTDVRGHTVTGNYEFDNDSRVAWIPNGVGEVVVNNNTVLPEGAYYIN
ncbi:polymorphic toxin type 30 domain-containing protein [Paenibacillus thalictri]|uniref:LysM peptidoglycan-binding domain-containing protein n=1 Tax=Paenibacillus thalictri TaxID=2527873 RepID=A0A4Q9DGF0_9BACL|nr:polymorphic toxin type 30 domain-containing protein [Paenibacillus thalictri]TBL71232.1 LysM peptidoglycan-binding domain-containing protein [Paenibacillus thalictri]